MKDIPFESASFDTTWYRFKIILFIIKRLIEFSVFLRWTIFLNRNWNLCVHEGTCMSLTSYLYPNKLLSSLAATIRDPNSASYISIYYDICRPKTEYNGDHKLLEYLNRSSQSWPNFGSCALTTSQFAFLCNLVSSIRMLFQSQLQNN